MNNCDFFLSSQFLSGVGILITHPELCHCKQKWLHTICSLLKRLPWFVHTAVVKFI